MFSPQIWRAVSFDVTIQSPEPLNLNEFLIQQEWEPGHTLDFGESLPKMSLRVESLSGPGLVPRFRRTFHRRLRSYRIRESQFRNSKSSSYRSSSSARPSPARSRRTTVQVQQPTSIPRKSRSIPLPRNTTDILRRSQASTNEPSFCYRRPMDRVFALETPDFIH